jgi:hypothetical protein
MLMANKASRIPSVNVDGGDASDQAFAQQFI